MISPNWSWWTSLFNGIRDFIYYLIRYYYPRILNTITNTIK